MEEQWLPVVGYEGRYEVSNLGRVRSVSFSQRYLLRNGKEAFRQTVPRIRKQKTNNSGYRMVTLCLNDVDTTYLVHRLVATAFVSGGDRTVNHKSGVKSDNRACNLEWASYSENLNHAVSMGLNPRAEAVADPITGTRYPSIRAAVIATGVGEKRIRNNWDRV